MPVFKLETLLSALPDKKVYGSTDADIGNISSDSRSIVPKTLFVAIPGFVVDGMKFIPDVIRKGVKAIIAEKDFSCPDNITRIIVPSSRKAIALLAACFYSHPSDRLKLIGITGTKGKSTTSHLIYSILNECNFKTGLSTTIEIRTTKIKLETKRTTNEALGVQNFLNMLVNENADFAVMEVSSHGLALDRVTGCNFDSALFTNLSHDHLDFHHTFPEYLNAKIKLFKMLKDTGTGIVNIDDPNSRDFLDICRHNKLTYGLNKNADITADNIIYDEKGMACRILTHYGEFCLRSSLHGEFNLYNILAATAIAVSFKLNLSDIKAGLEKLTVLPGRFEYINRGQPFQIIIDYAHSPDSLEQVLKTAKSLTKGRILLLFGATGNRDKTKRPIMGKIAAEFSDNFIITNDDTYDEDPMDIIEQIKRGTNNDKYKVIPDRKEAIYTLINDARPGDFLIIAGKGHETKQVLKDKVIEFNDRNVVEEILNKILILN